MKLSLFAVGLHAVVRPYLRLNVSRQPIEAGTKPGLSVFERSAARAVEKFKIAVPRLTGILSSSPCQLAGGNVILPPFTPTSLAPS